MWFLTYHILLRRLFWILTPHCRICPHTSTALGFHGTDLACSTHPHHRRGCTALKNRQIWIDTDILNKYIKVHVLANVTIIAESSWLFLFHHFRLYTDCFSSTKFSWLKVTEWIKCGRENITYQSWTDFKTWSE